MRRRLVAGAVLMVVLAGGAFAVLRPDDASGLDRARAALMDDDGFVNGPTAGLTFAKASELLLDDGTACQRENGRDDPRCSARLSAAAYSGVAAFIVAECTAPGVFEARTAMLDYVGRLAAFEGRSTTHHVPSPPDVPTC